MNVTVSFLSYISTMMSMIFLALVFISCVSCRHVQNDLTDSERVKRAACSFTYSGTTGTISSHNGYGRSNYNDNTDCTYTIQSSGTVYLSFDEVSIEYQSNCGYDYIEVNGEKICGTERKTFVFNNVLGSIKFNFHTDGSVTSRGFKASYSTDNDNCRIRTTATSGILTSPRSGYNTNRYGNNLDCDYVINNNGVNDIILSIEMFNVENHYSCVYDALELPSNYITPSKLCGTINSGTTYRLRNVSGPTTLRFRSDGSVTGLGFRLRYTIGSNSSESTNYTTYYSGGYNSTNSSNWSNYTTSYPGGYNYTTPYYGGYNSTNSSNWNNYNGSYSGYNSTNYYPGYNYTTSYPGYNYTNSSNSNGSYPGYNSTNYDPGYNYTTSYPGYNYTTSYQSGYNSRNSPSWYYNTTSNSSNWNYTGGYNLTTPYPGRFNYTIGGFNFTTSSPSNNNTNPNSNHTTFSR